MFFHMVYKSGQIFLPFCHNPRVCQTDRQTDGQTEFSSLGRVCIPCSAVKIRRLADTNVWACACDRLYRTVTKFSFLPFYSDYENECSFV